MPAADEGEHRPLLSGARPQADREGRQPHPNLASRNLGHPAHKLPERKGVMFKAIFYVSLGVFGCLMVQGLGDHEVRLNHIEDWMKKQKAKEKS